MAFLHRDWNRITERQRMDLSLIGFNIPVLKGFDSVPCWSPARKATTNMVLPGLHPRTNNVVLRPIAPPRRNTANDLKVGIKSGGKGRIVVEDMWFDVRRRCFACDVPWSGMASFENDNGTWSNVHDLEYQTYLPDPRHPTIAKKSHIDLRRMTGRRRVTMLIEQTDERATQEPKESVDYWTSEGDIWTYHVVRPMMIGCHPLLVRGGPSQAGLSINLLGLLLFPHSSDGQGCNNLSLQSFCLKTDVSPG